MQHKRRNHTTGIGNGVGERLKKLDTIAFPTTLPAFIIVSRGPGPRFDSPGSCPSVKTQCQAHSWRISPRTCVLDIFDSPGPRSCQAHSWRYSQITTTRQEQPTHESGDQRESVLEDPELCCRCRAFQHTASPRSISIPCACLALAAEICNSKTWSRPSCS